MIPDRLPVDWPDICRSVGITRIHVDPGWQSDQRARIDRTFRPIGVAWHHDGIPPGHRTIERWVTEHTVGGRWGTTTYIMCIWPDGTLIIHGCRWSVNTGLSVPAVVQLVRDNRPVPPYPHGPRGSSSTDTNDEFYGVVFHGGTRDGSSLADTFTTAAIDTAGRLTRAFAAIGVQPHQHVEHRQLSPDRKPDPFWGDRNIAAIAAAQPQQPPGGGSEMDAQERALLAEAAKAGNLLSMWLDPAGNPTAMSNHLRAGATRTNEILSQIKQLRAEVADLREAVEAVDGGTGATPASIARASADEFARRMKG